MHEKKTPRSKDSNNRIRPKPLLEEAAEQDTFPQTSLDNAIGSPPEMPVLANTAALRRQLIQRLQGQLGNAIVASRFADKGNRSDRGSYLPPPGFLQRDDDSGTPGAAPGASIGAATGGGASAVTTIQNGTEEFYDVSGATLNDITGQLAHFDGRYGAQTETQLGISTAQMSIQRLPNGSLRVEVPWAITSAVVGLPRWTDHDGACAAAQQEWDRFMLRTRQHEQEAHVDVAHQFVRDLGPADRIVTGRNRAALASNLTRKQQTLRGRLQTLHNGCDHGAGIDAILHPNNGRCP